MRRLVLLPLVAVAATVLLTSCSDPIRGSGSAKSAAPAASVSTSAATTPTTPSPSPTATPTLTPTQLLALVEPVPADATASTDPWAANRTPSIAQFAAVQYAAADADAGAAALEAAGVEAIAHRSWYVPRGASADDILLAFAAPSDARAWFSRAVASTAGATGYTAVPAVAGLTGYTFATPNSGGDVVTVFYGVVNAVGIVVDYWTPARYAASAAQAWLPPQVARLR